MPFVYKPFAQSHVVSDTQEQIVINDVSAEILYVRTLVLANYHASNTGVFEMFLVPNAAGLPGTAAADDKIVKISVVAGATEIVEFPIPGLILEYNDALEIVCDNADTLNLVMTGGREY